MSNVSWATSSDDPAENRLSTMGPRDPLDFCRALWRRAYPERRSHNRGRIRGRGEGGGREGGETTPTPTSRRTCAPWWQRALSKTRAHLHHRPGHPELLSQQPRSVPAASLYPRCIPTSLRGFGPRAKMKSTTATWRFSWQRASIDSSLLQVLEKREIRERDITWKSIGRIAERINCFWEAFEISSAAI